MIILLIVGTSYDGHHSIIWWSISSVQYFSWYSTIKAISGSRHNWHFIICGTSECSHTCSFHLDQSIWTSTFYFWTAYNNSEISFNSLFRIIKSTPWQARAYMSRHTSYTNSTDAFARLNHLKQLFNHPSCTSRLNLFRYKKNWYRNTIQIIHGYASIFFFKNN